MKPATASRSERFVSGLLRPRPTKNNTASPDLHAAPSNGADALSRLQMPAGV
jgi:hypothetical protein